MKTLYHMDQWFKRPPGSMLLELAHQHIDPLLSKIPGDTAIQIGGPSDLSLLESCQHNLKCYYSFSGETTPNTPSIRGNLLQLPILPECCDLLLVNLPHDCIEHIPHLLGLLKKGHEVVIRGWAIIPTESLQDAEAEIRNHLARTELISLQIESKKSYAANIAYVGIEVHLIRS